MDDEQRKRLSSVYERWEKRARPHTIAVDPRLPKPYSDRLQPRRAPKKAPIESSVPAPAASFVPTIGVSSGDLVRHTRMKYLCVNKCCQTCVPYSRKKFCVDGVTSSGMKDILKVNTRKYNSWVARHLPYTYHVWKMDTQFPPIDLRKNTLKSQRVRKAVEQCAQVASEEGGGSHDYQTALRQQEKRAVSIVYGMSSAISKTLLRVANWTLFWLLARLFNGVYVDRGHITMLREANKGQVPIIFLPGHKSHMDYILMSFVLANIGITVPHIASGDNLSLWGIGWLIKHLGGFFIKRKLDTAAGKDVLYRKCLHEYMVELLTTGQNIEFFMEGSRSRSGKPGMPKAGLLSVLVDTVKEGTVQDIMIVPVSISYDKLMEKNFVPHELMGGSKTPETFFSGLKGAWAMLTYKAGSARVDFAEPFSLQEFISNGRISKQSLLALSQMNGNGNISPSANDQERKLVSALSHHIVYQVSQCSVPMATNMVAFLLMTKYREGVALPDLISSYEWLEEKITSKGSLYLTIGFPFEYYIVLNQPAEITWESPGNQAKQHTVALQNDAARVQGVRCSQGSGCKMQPGFRVAVGFSGEPADAVRYALNLLSDLVEVSRCTRTNGVTVETQWITPRLALPTVFRLHHCFNQVSPIFALDSVIACSIQRVSGSFARSGDEGEDQRPTTKISLPKDKLIVEGVELCRLLGREFFFAPPCVDLCTVVDEAIDSFIVADIFKVKQAGPSQASRYDDEDKDRAIWLEVSHDSAHLDHLQFLQLLLDPFLEAYFLTATSLLERTGSHDENQLGSAIQEEAVRKGKKGLLRNEVSCSMDTIRNAVKTFTDMDILSLDQTDGHLHLRYPDLLLQIAEALSEYRP
ncbi:hypothetical protein EMCRGX_G028812 [Ephydatia muelleri]